MTTPAAGTEPTDREIEALRAYAVAGDYVRAAEIMGVSRKRIGAYLAAARARAGVESTVAAIWHYRHRVLS